MNYNDMSTIIYTRGEYFLIYHRQRCRTIIIIGHHGWVLSRVRTVLQVSTHSQGIGRGIET